VGDRVGVEDSEFTIENDTVGVAVATPLFENVVEGLSEME